MEKYSKEIDEQASQRKAQEETAAAAASDEPVTPASISDVVDEYSD
jgi:hypothetical protein